MTLRRLLRMRRADRLGRLLSESELAYLSRSIFRQRIDAPNDQAQLAAQLDPLVSVARMRAARASVRPEETL